MLEAFFMVLMLEITGLKYAELGKSMSKSETSECGLEIAKIDLVDAKELWALDYLDMLQSPNGPLLRTFVYADYRQAKGIKKRPLAILVISRRLRSENVDVFRVSSFEGISLSKIAIAEKNSEYDFRINADNKVCSGDQSEEIHFFEVTEDEVIVHSHNTFSKGAIEQRN